MTGIYIITNKINGKSYVGSSKRIKKRVSEHLRNKGDHHNSYFSKDIDEFGKENFFYKIICECKEEELKSKELYYISKFGTAFPNGYNKECGENGKKKYHKSVYAKKRKRINMYDLNGVYIRTFESIQEASKFANADFKKNSSCIKIKNTPTIYHGYQFKLFNGNTEDIQQQKPRKKMTDETKNKISLSQNKKVSQFFKSGVFIKEFSSAKEAEEKTGVNRKNISQVCKKQRKSAGGYNWFFV